VIFNKPWKQFVGKWIVLESTKNKTGPVDFMIKYMGYNSYDNEATYWGYYEGYGIFKYLYLHPGEEGKIIQPNDTRKREVIRGVFNKRVNPVE
jgi:hypothetical protein